MKTSHKAIPLCGLILIVMITFSYVVDAKTYIITAESNDIPLELLEQMASLNAELTSILEGTGVAIATSTHPEFETEVAKIPGIKSVTPDVQIQWIPPQVSGQHVPYTNPPNSKDDDDFFNLQWGLDAVNAIEAWNLGYRGAGVLVAVLDSGFDLVHPDLKPNIIMKKSKSFVPGEDLQFVPGASDLSHGSHVAGIIAAADNGVGVIGVAPDAKMMLCKVLGDAGTGSLSWALEAITYAADKGADVINMSLGALLDKTSPIVEALNRATTYAHEKGVTIFAAVGNEAYDLNSDDTKIMMPAGADHVISIGATAPIGWALAPTTNLDNHASYSNFGFPGVDLSAPGGDIQYAGNEQTTIAGVTDLVKNFDQVYSANIGGWAFASGTSMATPHAAGVAALVIQAFGGRSKITPDQVERILTVSSIDLGEPGPDANFGVGRLDALRAVTCHNCLEDIY